MLTDYIHVPDYHAVLRGSANALREVHVVALALSVVISESLGMALIDEERYTKGNAVLKSSMMSSTSL